MPRGGLSWLGLIPRIEMGWDGLFCGDAEWCGGLP